MIWEVPESQPLRDLVEDVRDFERRGWLRDPATVEWPADPEHPANRQRAYYDAACPPLCWRERCKRAGRCRHLLALAIREFQPELCHHFNMQLGVTSPLAGADIDPLKLAIVATVFPRIAGDR